MQTHRQRHIKLARTLARVLRDYAGAVDSDLRKGRMNGLADALEDEADQAQIVMRLYLDPEVEQAKQDLDAAQQEVDLCIELGY